MDVLQQIFRDNGRAVNHLNYEDTTVGEERGRYYIRGHYQRPREVMTVYLTEAEIDRLTAVRQRQPGRLSAMVAGALRGLSNLGGIHDSRRVSHRIDP